jgi:cytochrome c oxidase assembly protein subunit 15
MLTRNIDNFKRSWILLSIICVIAMIIIGGYTRLTNSGLSIVEWKPITGAIPPLSLDDWNIEFEKYKQSPEYQKINFSFSIEEFKDIYYVEYFHRLMGRILACIFFLPFFYLILKRELTPKELRSYSIIMILLMLQGFMGWYMVKSGLVLNPHVSHFRLATHLLMACILIHALTVEYLSISSSRVFIGQLLTHSNFVIFNLYIQIISGALVAGLDAGLVYNSFPLMDGRLIPPEFSNIIGIFDIFTSPGSVQFIHRMIAYFLLVNILFFCYRLMILFRDNKQVMLATAILSALSLLQVALGITTLLLVVPLSFALLHQLCGILLLITAVYVKHIVQSVKEIVNARL